MNLQGVDLNFLKSMGVEQQAGLAKKDTAHLEQFAKDFESVFVQKLLEQMQETVGQWGYEKEQGSEQIYGMFGMFLSQHVSDNGGLGLSKEIYKFMEEQQQSMSSANLDEKL